MDPQLTTRRSILRIMGGAVGGAALLTGCGEQTVIRTAWRIKAPGDGGVYSVGVAPDGQSVISGASDHSLRLWSVPDGALLRTFTGHTGEVFGTAFLPDGTMLASASRDQPEVWPPIPESLVEITGLTGPTLPIFPFDTVGAGSI